MGAITEVSAPVTPKVPAQGPQKPEHIPEKFWNAKDGKVDVDGLAKSYTSLEQAFSSKTPPPPAAPPAPKTPDPKGEDETLKIPEPSSDAPKTPEGNFGHMTEENIGKWATELQEKGQLSEATYKEIGLPKILVDGWIAGQLAIMDRSTGSLLSTIGGKENYMSMSEWASQNVPKAERDAFNEIQRTGSPAAKKVALEGMYARFKNSEGVHAGRHIAGGPGGQTGIQPFASKRQMLDAMKDPRYKGQHADPAYIAEIEARAKASRF